MNKIYEKTIKDKYVPITDLTITTLMELKCISCWTLYFSLARIQSFKNGLVGVFEELNFYGFIKVLEPLSKTKLNTDKVQRIFKKLEKANLIKLINKKPLILSLTTAEQSESFDSINDVLAYVQLNETEFNFHMLHKRANKFYSTFGQERKRIVLKDSENTINKENKLHQLINNRVSKSINEIQEALEWRNTIADEDDPFKAHFNQNTNN